MNVRNKKKKEKEILTRIEKRFRDLKSNLRKKISLEEMMHSSSFKQGLSGKQKCQTVHVELKKKKKKKFKSPSKVERANVISSSGDLTHILAISEKFQWISMDFIG